ncbi:DNA circularization N-terminal domain-containing protein [Candidatus Pacearchaeota archaeon]|nr:DNA circularization N-terminal domain-containing protein [Candidatus Pacearchaeota archaeon]
MSIEQELQRASFRGVTFFWSSTTTTGGRKVVLHEFPNKDTRFAEDLGQLPKSFVVEATVGHLNYSQNRDALITALEKEGFGTLVHPTLGTFEVQALPYTLNENISELGKAKFTLPFERTEPNVFPIKAVDNQAAITSKSESLFSKIKDNIASAYQSVANQFEAFNDAKDKVQDFVDKANAAANKVRQVSAKISEFANDLNNITEDINQLVVAPAQLAASLNNVIVLGQNLFETPAGVFSYYQSLFDYGVDDVVIALITTERQLTQANRDVLNSNLQSDALVGAYQSIVNLEFETTDDIEDIRTIVEDQYLKLMDDQLLDFDTKELLQDLRNEVETFLGQEEQNTSNITTLQVYNEPITVLMYRLYGDLDKTDTVINLNSVENFSFIDQNVNVLTEG